MENSEYYKGLNQMGIVSDSIMPNKSHSELGTRVWKDYMELSLNKKIRLYIVEKKVLINMVEKRYIL